MIETKDLRSKVKDALWNILLVRITKEPKAFTVEDSEIIKNLIESLKSLYK